MSPSDEPPPPSGRDRDRRPDRVADQLMTDIDLYLRVAKAKVSTRMLMVRYAKRLPR